MGAPKPYPRGYEADDMLFAVRELISCEAPRFVRRGHGLESRARTLRRRGRRRAYMSKFRGRRDTSRQRALRIGHDEPASRRALHARHFAQAATARA